MFLGNNKIVCLINFIAVESNKFQVPNVLNVCGFVRDSGHKLFRPQKENCGAIVDRTPSD